MARWPRATLAGSGGVPGAGMRVGKQGIGAVDLVAGGAEVLPHRAEVGAAGDAVLHQPGGLGLVSVGAGAGVDAQLSLQRLADRSGADEPDQVLGEDRRLRLGGQTDGEAPGGDVIDGASPGVCGGDAVADQPLVQLQIRELALFDARASARVGRAAGRGPAAGPYALPGWAAGARAIVAVRGLALVPGCDWGWAWVIGPVC